MSGHAHDMCKHVFKVLVLRNRGCA